MISQELIDILLCPDDQSALHVADQALIGRINQAIASRQLRNKAGQAVEKPIDGGLLREDGKRLYPIVDGIPVMLADEAILLDQLAER